MTTVSQGNGGSAAVPLTGQQYQISAGHYRATVTELGAGLRELLYHGQPVIASYEPNEPPPSAAATRLPTALVRTPT